MIPVETEFSTSNFQPFNEVPTFCVYLVRVFAHNLYDKHVKFFIRGKNCEKEYSRETIRMELK